jgi:hypothetical protein
MLEVVTSPAGICSSAYMIIEFPGFNGIAALVIIFQALTVCFFT